VAEKIKLVQNDTKPQINLSLTDETTGDPIDLTGATVRMHFRAAGSATIKETLILGLLTGRVLEDGSIDTTPPYDTPGRGGRCYVTWGETTLDTVGEFEGEVFVTFADSGIQTVYDVLKFKVRDEF
jgi:hypothetical protein